jgi:hypothetical protein
MCCKHYLVESFWKTIGRFFKKLKIELPYNLAFPLLGIYPNKLELAYQQHVCTPMFTAVLITVICESSPVSITG